MAHLATEPTGELFGADYVYPFGYAGTAHETGNDSKCILNYMLHKIDIKNPDIILCGSQSGTVPMVFETLPICIQHLLIFARNSTGRSYTLC